MTNLCISPRNHTRPPEVGTTNRAFQRGLGSRWRRRHGSAGFTLLEMLLAVSLSIVLLATMWSLMSVYTNLFDKGQKRIESSQLVRSLMQQMSEDLRAAIQDPIAGVDESASAPSPERRFGLFGSANELRFDVLQLTPMRANATPVGGRGTTSEEASPARVPELRTVHYEFVSTGSPEEVAGVAQRGLVRRELDFESPALDFDETGLVPATNGPDTSLLSSAGREPPADPAELPASAVDDSMLWVPEVAAIEFRFFDGNGWTSQWNSIQRKSLPVAVEVTLHITPADARTPSEVPTDELLAEDDGVAAPETVHRLVIDLPGSPSYRKSPVAKAAPTRPARPAARRIAPPRWTPREQSTRGSDQWIRTGGQ